MEKLAETNDIYSLLKNANLELVVDNKNIIDEGSNINNNNNHSIQATYAISNIQYTKSIYT